MGAVGAKKIQNWLGSCPYFSYSWECKEQVCKVRSTRVRTNSEAFSRFFSNSGNCTPIGPVHRQPSGHRGAKYRLGLSHSSRGRTWYSGPNPTQLEKPVLLAPPTSSDTTSSLLRTLVGADIFASYLPELSVTLGLPKPSPGRGKCPISRAQCLYQCT